MPSFITKFLYQYELMRGELGGRVAQRLDKRMRSQISPCVSSCREGGGGGILKTKNTGKPISFHFAMRLKSQIYLNYAYLQMFQRRKSPFIPCCTRLQPGKQTVAGSILTSGTFFRGDLVMKKMLQPFSPFRCFKKGSCQLLAKECARSTVKLSRRLAQEVWIGWLTYRTRNDLKWAEGP